MTDIPRLPEVLEAMQRPRLHYRGIVCWEYADVPLPRDWQRRSFPTWKPVLVIHLDGWPVDVPWASLTIRANNPDRSRHRHQQDVGGFVQLVQRFTAPGAMVCDPFLGSGTTGLAALTTSRRFIGADIDRAAVASFRRSLLPAQRRQLTGTSPS